MQNMLSRWSRLSWRSFSTRPKNNDNKIIKLEQQMFQEYMIPGQFHKFFKSKQRKREKQRCGNDANTPEAAGLDHVHKESPRLTHDDGVQSTPAQERLAQRIQRGITNMYAIEPLPTRWVTPSFVCISHIKPSKNLRRCQIFYEPIKTASKEEKGFIHRALQTHTPRLESLIRLHAGIKHPLSIRFVPDTKKTELDAIYDQITAELEQEKN